MTKSSLRARRSSGFPERKDFIIILPSMDELTMYPLVLNKMVSLSIISTNISFFCFFPPLVDAIAMGILVAVEGLVRGFIDMIIEVVVGAGVTKLLFKVENKRYHPINS